MSIALPHWTALIAVLSIAGCASSPPAPSGALTPYELKRNISTAAGNPVTVKGFLQFAFENHSLWLDRKTSNELRQDSCVGVSTPDGVDLTPLHNKYVVLSGVVRQIPDNVVYFNACGGATLEVKADALPILYSP